MATTSKQPAGKAASAAVRKAATRRADGSSRPAAKARVGKRAAARLPAAEVREGIARSLKGLIAIEADIASLVRRTVVDALPDGAATAKQLHGLVRDVVTAGIEGTEQAGIELVVSIKGIAKGVVLGVNDIRADLGKAASETVRIAIKHAGRLRGDVVAVAERAMEGIASAVDDAGGRASALSTRVNKGASAVSRKLGRLGTDTVTKMLQKLSDELNEVHVPAPRARRRQAAAPSRAAASAQAVRAGRS